MSTEETAERIDALLKQANDLAVDWLRSKLLRMLKENPKKIDEIVNRMGVTAFYKKGEPLWSHEVEELKGYEELVDFMNDYDDIFKLTGEDMEFKRSKV